MPPRAPTHPASPARRRADPARHVAFQALCGVCDRDAYVNLLLPALLRDAGLSGRDAALATELAYGTLRGQGSYDAILAICSDRDVDRIDPPLRQVLRMGAHQLLATRIGAHAAVATSVDLAKDVAGQRPAGFVNAVLRKVATRDFEAWLEIAAPSRGDDLTGHLSVAYSHPRWIVDAISEALGEDPAGGLAETEAVLAADGERPRVTLCAVPGLADPAELVAAGAEPGQWSPFAAVLAEGDPAQIAAVAQGRAAVQDEASQLAALALARVDLAGGAGATARWLDMCAGPGGKARLLAGLASADGARLLAADLRLHRAGLLRRALAGVSAAAVVAADGTAPAWRPGAFDRVLADVPCSGLGALRRRAEARWRRSPADVTALGPVQRALLATALDSASPGGVVAYVTCSPHVAETRDVVTAVLEERDDAEVLDAPAVLPEVPGLRCPGPHPEFAQFWPHRHGTDAIFLALLRRTA
ncbi:MAG TPA: transcription antitermination factor NusB [Streptosporangiaceae bacterium]|nr:transcription antitermination factor NusB [Streptosporangiaceae bacterium]